MESVLEKILKDICLPEGSQAEDWLKIFETLEGSSYAETLQNIENYICRNISFDTLASEAYVYFGTAMIMALDRAIRCGIEREESIYDRRGLMAI